MMNGFSAADMSTAAANGHAEGYQAGYADAVKAFDAAQPAAAQEAAWKLAQKVRTELDRASCPDAFMRLAVEAVMEHAAAPAAAAPVIDPSRLGAVMKAFDDAGGHAVSYAPAWMRKALEAASAPAAPGIDLDALRDIANDLSHSAKVDDYETQQIEFIESIRDRLLTVIDASPKGGEKFDYRADFFDANGAAVRAEGVLLEVRDWFETQARAISKGCGSTWDLQQVRDMRDRCDTVLQAASAEVRS